MYREKKKNKVMCICTPLIGTIIISSAVAKLIIKRMKCYSPAPYLSSFYLAAK